VTNVSRGASNRPRAVDVHAHILPTALLEALKGQRCNGFPTVGDDGRLVFGQRITSKPPGELGNVNLRLRDMDRMGVDMQVVSPWIELSPTGSDRTSGSAFLRVLNDSVAAEVARTPRRLRGLGLVSRVDVAEATRELIRLAGIRGMVGVELAAGGPGPALHGETWERFWRTAADLGSLVLLHPWQAACSADADVAGVGDIVDNPAQTSATVAALLLTGVIQRNPGLNLCLVHGGGCLPYLLGRLTRLGESLDSTPHRSLAAGLGSLWFDSLTHSSQALEFLARQVGTDRVLLGTDYPFRTGDAEGVRRVGEAHGLSDAERSAILRGNAIRLLGGLDTNVELGV
jgi:aminocarboxymuconate-semialdehyde decarboxylase